MNLFKLNGSWAQFPAMMVGVGFFIILLVNVPPHTVMSWEVTTVAAIWTFGWSVLAAIGHYFDHRARRAEVAKKWRVWPFADPGSRAFPPRSGRDR